MDDPGGGEAAGAAVARPPRRAQTWLFGFALVVLILGTLGGSLLARQRAIEAVDDRAARTASAVAAVLEVEIRQVGARMAGAGAVVDPEGRLDPAAFGAFAADRLDGQRAGPMTLLDVVTAEERADWEDEHGVAISVLDGDRLVPAPPSPIHYPAVAVEGADAGRSVIGLDFGADPARLAAIQRSGTTEEVTVSGPIVLSSTGEAGVALVRPVSGPDGVVRGFVATGLTTERIREAVDDAVETGSDVVLVDGDVPIVGEDVDDLDERQLASVDVAGRRWHVAVLPVADPDFTVAWMVAGAGLVAIATMLALLVLTERHHRRLARTNALLARNEERGRAVQDVAGRLARALTGSEVASAVIDHLPDAVGASRAVVAIMDRVGRLEVLEPGDEPRVLPAPEAGTVVGTVLSLRSPAWLASPLGWRDDPVAVDLAGGSSALAVLPLLSDDVAGVLSVGYPQLHIFGEEEQALLQTVGVLAGRALARGRRYDAEHQAAVAFQRAALPDALPSVPGLSIAARYRPAVHGATVGGDWYDVLRLPDGRVLLVVGDVVGHGMTAAAAMGRLRTAFQTIVPYRGDPGSMLQGISQQIDSIPDAFCTTVVSAAVDPADGSLAWSRAGHPPPLVVSPGGGSRLLDAPCLPPLGVAPDQEAPVHHDRLAPGEVLVLYTDGIVERREEPLDQGFRRLALVAEQLVDLEVEELADALVEAMVPADTQADDLAVLVVRADPPGSAG